MCVCVDVHLSEAARARPRVCCSVLCLLSPPQSALNYFLYIFFFIVDYEATAARSSVNCVKSDYRYRD